MAKVSTFSSVSHKVACLVKQAAMSNLLIYIFVAGIIFDQLP